MTIRVLKTVANLASAVRASILLYKNIFQMSDYPSSAGSYIEKAKLTFLGALHTHAAILEFVGETNASAIRETLDYTAQDENYKSASEQKLRSILDKWGSDKGTFHQYSPVYSKILSELITAKPNQKLVIGEIGLGTSNTKVLSNMGPKGKPGASLRAWREFLEGREIRILGFDVDKEALFLEENIETYYLDQLDTKTFSQIPTILDGDKFDLFIDDGLHAPIANINFLNHAKNHVRPGGFLVVEDIARQSLDVWKLVAETSPKNWKCEIIKTRHAYMFIAQVLL